MSRTHNKSPNHVKQATIAATERMKEARTDFLNRFLDQEHLQINNKVVMSACNQYKPKNNLLCRNCRFYSVHVQEQKYGTHCKVWEQVFGFELRRTLEKLALEGVRIGEKFMQIWHARRLTTKIASTHTLVTLQRDNKPAKQQFIVPMIEMK